MKALLSALFTAAIVSILPAAESFKTTGDSINAFGLALHQRLAAEGGNVVASPWSIATALAIIYAGSDVKTKAEMAKVLHFGVLEAAVHEGMAGIAVVGPELYRKNQKKASIEPLESGLYPDRSVAWLTEALRIGLKP